MKAVFIPYNQALQEHLLEVLNKMSIRGFTRWDPVQGRGSEKGEPHYGDHAWPTLNSAILAIIPDEKVDTLLERIHAIDQGSENLGIHAFVWAIEKTI